MAARIATWIGRRRNVDIVVLRVVLHAPGPVAEPVGLVRVALALHEVLPVDARPTPVRFYDGTKLGNRRQPFAIPFAAAMMGATPFLIRIARTLPAPRAGDIAAFGLLAGAALGPWGLNLVNKLGEATHVADLGIPDLGVVDRVAWESPEYREVLRRCVAWAVHGVTWQSCPTEEWA